MTKHNLLRSASLGLGLSAMVLTTATQADISAGKALHTDSCVECHMAKHDDAFYQARAGKSDRNINSRDSLKTMVQACVTNFGIDWFDEEVDAVTEYLNATYYNLD